jgi:hypothetical protein
MIALSEQRKDRRLRISTGWFLCIALPLLLFTLYFLQLDYRVLLVVSPIGYVVFALVYQKELKNVMFLTLTGFLAAPAIWSFICVCVLKGYVSVWFEELQTVENTTRILILTLVALFAHGFGWRLGLNRAEKIYDGQIVSRTYANRLSRLNPLYLFVFFTLAAVFTGWQAGVSSVPIWEGAYGRDHSGQIRILSLGVYPIWAVANLIVAYVLLRKYFLYDKAMRVIWFLAVLFVVGYEFIAKGSRLEGVAFLIAFLAVKYVLDGRSPSFIRVFLFSIIVLFLVNLVGYIRSSFHLGGIQNYALRNTVRFTRLNQAGVPVGSVSTIGPVSATFYRALVDIDDNVHDYMYGSSYIDFIPRTLPEFIYPDRPRAIVWNHSAQGGIFSLAEAYLNFGACGCLIVPLVISFLLSRYVCGRVLFLRDPSWWELGWYGLLTAALVRGIWYQVFTVYKSWIATLILWQLVCLIVSFSRRNPIQPILRKNYGIANARTRTNMSH